MDSILAALFFLLGFVTAVTVPYVKEWASRPKAPYIQALPPELLIQVFSKCARTSDARALSKTCKQFRKIWKAHGKAIVDSIQSDIILSYAAARSLADAIDFVRSKAGQADELATIYGSAARDRRVLIHRHAQEVGILTDYFLYNAVGQDLSHPPPGNSLRRQPPYMTMTERARFASACYRIWEHTVYSYLKDADERKQRQDASLDISLSDHWLLCEVIFFFSYHRQDLTRSSFDGLPSQGPTTHNRKEFQRITQMYCRKLQQAGHNGVIATHRGCPRDLYMAIFDDLQGRRRQFFLDIIEGRHTHD